MCWRSFFGSFSCFLGSPEFLDRIVLTCGLDFGLFFCFLSFALFLEFDLLLLACLLLPERDRDGVLLGDLLFVPALLAPSSSRWSLTPGL